MLLYTLTYFFLTIGGSRVFLQRQDYDIRSDLDENLETEIVFAYRQGAGVDQHPSSSRGSATVSFASGESSVVRAMVAPSALAISCLMYLVVFDGFLFFCSTTVPWGCFASATCRLGKQCAAVAGSIELGLFHIC